MPPAKPKPLDVASEAKRIYIPYIAQTSQEPPPPSEQIPDSAYFPVNPAKRGLRRLRVAVTDGDPVDVALDLPQHLRSSSGQLPRIPAINMANEKRPGGDWESGLLAPEECLCRRSNLIHSLSVLKFPAALQSHQVPQYPMPQRGGIYSPNVGMSWQIPDFNIPPPHRHHQSAASLQDLVVFRDGPEQYQIWQNFGSLPIISVAPVRRPKLDESGKTYSFSQERDLMLEKMRTILRIAAFYDHESIVLGAFGVGHIFRNPAREVACMWRQLLFHDPEFVGVFANVVFAVQTMQPGNGTAGEEEHEIFAEEFEAWKTFEEMGSASQAASGDSADSDATW